MGNIIEILLPAMTGFVGYLARGTLEKYFILRPNITIKIINKNSRSINNSDKNTSIIRHTPTIEFFNNSKHNALNLTIYYTNADIFKESIFKPLYFDDHKILKGYDKEKIHLEIPIKKNKNNITKPKEFLPDEIKHLSFLLTYQNEKGRKFYNEFANNETKTYTRKKKKFRKYFQSINKE